MVAIPRTQAGFFNLRSRVFPGEDAALARERLHVVKAAWLLVEVAFRSRVGDVLKP
jgi:hypothetical protein